MASIDFLPLIIYFLQFISLARGQTVCYDTGNFTNNGTYAKNRGLLLSSLTSNVTANGGFYTTSVGQDSDKVYGLVMCRPDSTEEACSDCVSSGIQDIVTTCPNQKEAILWGGGKYPPCIIRYADRPISGKMELDPSQSGYNTANLTSDIEEFNQIWSNLMEQVGTKASTGSSKIKAATGKANLTLFQNIYVLMQCTPDLSQSSCNYCLQQAVANYRSCCFGKVGGYTIKPSCWFRWDLYIFYTPIADSPQPSPHYLPSPLPLPSPTSPIVRVSFLVLVLSIYSLLTRNKPRKLTESVCERTDDISTTAESLQFDIGTIRVATNNFSDDNKIGEGGFGTVYKGRLPDGVTIAVKRWSRYSKQGEVEFKNEVLLMAMLQHKNLVRLLGFCLEEKEKLLIYEFVPNSSLHYYVFDSNRRLLLDWKMRYNIIEGIARGILYIHEDSPTRIIHRDLKASNILLDEQMNPKISDFGTAKLFEADHSQIATRRIVGTYGYMPPEYVKHGKVSVKTDVFSFGVLLLEIISGQKANCFRDGRLEENLLTCAWRSWNEGAPLNLIDKVALCVGSRKEMIRCIHIGLLCVQEDVAKRPTMASVVLMLSDRSITLPRPSRPAFLMMQETLDKDLEASPNQEVTTEDPSVNEVSFSELGPR
ncbi:cysteine-rich receptor-like protein kinase 44 isoform X2 [Ricinus communis]|uniref:cysteine-rich receptor-like protein kinase 44 isoform X2 n=1 Tax=Ricinus communis TaxID=3988 RepID=UPI000D68AE39|nr:cysteine-rich receptor-like protein kinase 44 isoform X2 [Ricinus communis]|eukprot:XP_025012983.1 putative receptor-like protein kinase At4g00960 isoform X2 [Ricinus communis]